MTLQGAAGHAAARQSTAAGPAADDALMARVTLRDAAAFRALVDGHAPHVHALAWRMTGDASVAEDVAQEAMMRLWSHANRWQAGGPGVGAWLRRVATNLVFDRSRRPRFVAEDAIPERADEAMSADEAMDAARLRDAARDAVMALPERQRAAIVLTYYEDLPNAEAADLLGLHIKAFESLLLRARSALKVSCAAYQETRP